MCISPETSIYLHKCRSFSTKQTNQAPSWGLIRKPLGKRCDISDIWSKQLTDHKWVSQLTNLHFRRTPKLKFWACKWPKYGNCISHKYQSLPFCIFIIHTCRFIYMLSVDLLAVPKQSSRAEGLARTPGPAVAQCQWSCNHGLQPTWPHPILDWWWHKFSQLFQTQGIKLGIPRAASQAPGWHYHCHGIGLGDIKRLLEQQ